MEQPHLSLVIPAFREELRLEVSLRAITAFLRKQPWSWEIILVDDGSTDSTMSIAQRFQESEEPRMRLLHHSVNQGKGAAVRTGMMAARGAFAIFTDADNATPIEELPKLLAAAENGADVVIGSRYLHGSEIVGGRSVIRQLMSRLGNFLFRALLGLRLSDTRCGFKLFSAHARLRIFPRQTLLRWGFDTELLLIAQRQGIRVVEVPVTWYDRERGHIHPVRDTVRSFSELLHMVRLLWKGNYDQ